MPSSLRLTLRAGDRLYVNGAVLAVDRKVGIELLNGADFLLDRHVLDAGAVNSLSHHLYYVIQCMVMAPQVRPAALAMCRRALSAASRARATPEAAGHIERLRALIDADRPIDALKALRKTWNAAAVAAGSRRSPGAGVAGRRAAGG